MHRCCRSVSRGIARAGRQYCGQLRPCVSGHNPCKMKPNRPARPLHCMESASAQRPCSAQNCGDQLNASVYRVTGVRRTSSAAGRRTRGMRKSLGGRHVSAAEPSVTLSVGDWPCPVAQAITTPPASSRSKMASERLGSGMIEADVNGRGRLGQTTDRDKGDASRRNGGNRIQPHAARCFGGHSPADQRHGST